MNVVTGQMRQQFSALYPRIPPYRLSAMAIALQPVFAYWRFVGAQMSAS